MRKVVVNMTISLDGFVAGPNDGPDSGRVMVVTRYLIGTSVAIAKAIPNAKHITLDGQTHEVDSVVLAPVLTEFFKA